MKEYISIAIGGTVFGFGLAYSGAAIPEVVLDFLQLENFGLALILIVAVIITFATYTWAPKLLKQPVVGDQFKKKQSVFSKETISGAALFGVGWGVSGLCPGTVLSGVGMGNFVLLFGVAGMFLGTLVNGYFRKRGS